MRVASVASAFPDHYYPQETLFGELRRMWPNHPERHRFEALQRSVGVDGRYTALPIEQYRQLRGFKDKNDAYLSVGAKLAETAIATALQKAQCSAASVGHIFSVSVTGIATPSLDARLFSSLGFSPSIKRTPVFGLGCVAGAAGLARVADYLKAYPNEVAILLSVELCTLTFQRDSESMVNLIATALFADGAAAVVMTGDALGGEGPRIVATRSVMYPDTLDAMGWDVTNQGFAIVLSRDVPELVRTHLRSDTESFLAECGLRLSDIRSWVMHPGGPKVLSAVQDAMGVDRQAFRVSWDMLRKIGNLSSASVLINLEQTLLEPRPPRGSYGLLAAVGPGFCAELVLLEW